MYRINEITVDALTPNVNQFPCHDMAPYQLATCSWSLTTSLHKHDMLEYYHLAPYTLSPLTLLLKFWNHVPACKIIPFSFIVNGNYLEVFHPCNIMIICPCSIHGGVRYNISNHITSHIVLFENYSNCIQHISSLFVPHRFIPYFTLQKPSCIFIVHWLFQFEGKFRTPCVQCLYSY